MINIEDFDKAEMRAGTVIDVKDNKKSRNPAYVVTIDFGEEIAAMLGYSNHSNLYKAFKGYFGVSPREYK